MTTSSAASTVAGIGGLPKTRPHRRGRRARGNLPARRARHVVGAGRRRRRPAVPERDVAVRRGRGDPRRRARVLSAIRRPGRARPARLRPHDRVDARARGTAADGRRAGHAADRRHARDARAVAARVHARADRDRGRQRARAGACRRQRRPRAVRVHRRAAHVPARRRRAADVRARTRGRPLSRQGAAARRRRRDNAAACRRPPPRPRVSRDPRRSSPSRNRRAPRKCARRGSATPSSGIPARSEARRWTTSSPAATRACCASRPRSRARR